MPSTDDDKPKVDGSSGESVASQESEPAVGFSNVGTTATVVVSWAMRIARIVAVIFVVIPMAYTIRLHAINTYGRVIHEFDPWFNFRATKYLADNGLYEFFHWFDHESWYPLGRPVGTTIYPGMQITAVGLWRALKSAPASLIALLQSGTEEGRDPVSKVMSLTDVCCFMPAWFGAITSCFLGLLTSEATGSGNAGVAAALVMSVIPAHIMRSVGGGFDNESVALAAMCSTFYFWILSLRHREVKKLSWVWGIVTGLAYINMVAAWGGYIFVLNMIAVHAAATVALGRYSQTLHRAYSLFYVIGTLGAVQIPVVGWVPFKSLEQISALGVFIVLNVIEIVALVERRTKLSGVRRWSLRVGVASSAASVVSFAIALLLPTGYFGPLSARIAGLFVKHTRTGNPLVDSVAEHQPTNVGAYKQYLHHTYKLAPWGFGVLCVLVVFHALGIMKRVKRIEGKIFLICYGLTAYYFSSKMSRLIILLGPIASALSGVIVGVVVDFSLDQLFGLVGYLWSFVSSTPSAAIASQEEGSDSQASASGSAPGTSSNGVLLKINNVIQSIQTFNNKMLSSVAIPVWNFPLVRIARLVFCIIAIGRSKPKKYWNEFSEYSHQIAKGMSQPSIMYEANLRDGTKVMVDDYREAYWWLRDNTPKNARVMAWWDYGYQIAGIAERTSIADGNTWNHEHIATLGRCLASPEKEAHRMVRHLADYVLIWTGGGGDDLAKSPHMARIGNSVYSDICPGDPTCSQFGFGRDGRPTPMMAASMLYKMHSHGQQGVAVDPNRFRFVFQSKYNKVRIFKVLKVSRKSKMWIANKTNWVCDAPGSWYCSGQYPPALAKVLAKRKSFKQVHDWNTKSSKEDEEYQKKYHARMEQRSG
jgi:dolichyl-diphosphooligosaccharide--protein glycosyltransferase